MPRYEYRCKDCGEHLEVVQSFRDDALTVCPRCDGALKKVFQPVGIAFKGTGFYKNDARSGGAKKSASSTSASDTSSGSDSSSSGSSDTSSSSTSDASSSSSSPSSDSSSGPSGPSGSSTSPSGSSPAKSA